MSELANSVTTRDLTGPQCRWWDQEVALWGLRVKLVKPANVADFNA